MRRLAATALLVSLAVCSAAVAAGDAVVQVTPPWSIYDYGIRTDKGQYYFPYSLNFQRHILDFLSEKKISAVPALYSSAFQHLYFPRNIEELDELLSYEPAEQSRYLTLIPVIKSSVLERKGTRYRIVMQVSVYLQDGKGGLGKELMTEEVVCKGKTADIMPAPEDYDRQLEEVRRQLSLSKGWQLIADEARKRSKDFPAFPTFDRASFFREQGEHFFGETAALYYSDSPECPDNTTVRLTKADILVLNTREHSSKVILSFDLADEWPVVLYAYVILPDRRILTPGPDDVHIEKSPSALPTDTYDSRRYLVINLPGVTPDAVICFAVKFNDRIKYDTAYFNDTARHPFRYPLARDFNFYYSNDTVPWQLRIWFRGDFPSSRPKVTARSPLLKLAEPRVTFFGMKPLFSDMLSTMKSRRRTGGRLPDPVLNSAVNMLSTPERSADHINARYHYKMFVLEGQCAPLPSAVYEQYAYVERPVVRVSTVASWDSLYSQVRDSIFSVIGRARLPLAVRADTASPAAGAFRLLKYMSDSLRYLHVSFDYHRQIPYDPDSVLNNRMGDCKDLSALLVRQLGLMGIRAFPALVNMTWPFSLSTDLPSYDAFDHMVVHVPQYDWWLDPTGFPVQPRIIPEYLCGLKSLVMYRDSLAVVDIGNNSDSMNLTAMRYEIEIAGGDLNCTYLEESSYGKSFYMRDQLPKVDSARQFDFIFPSAKYTARYSAVETGLSVENIESADGRVSVRRNFRVSNAVTRAGSQRFLNLPEMPLAWYVSMVSAQNRTTDLYLGTNLNCEVRIAVTGGYRAVWPEFPAAGRDYGDVMRVTVLPDNEICIRIRVGKGLVPLKDYRVLKQAMSEFRDFFSNPVVVRRTAQGQKSGPVRTHSRAAPGG